MFWGHLGLSVREGSCLTASITVQQPLPHAPPLMLALFFARVLPIITLHIVGHISKDTMVVVNLMLQ